MKTDRAFLEHIREETIFLLKQTEGLQLRQLLEDEVLKRAFARSLEIIGEAVRNLSPGLKKRNAQIEWKKISGMRDKLIHYYFGVNWDIVWSVIKNKLPELKLVVESELKEFKG
jgi:uncharacterized protein with HEPN domain